MSETTPHKVYRGSLANSYTPIDKFFLSPFVPSGSQFNLFGSPFQPLQVAYCSPAKNVHTGPRLEEMLIGMCDQCTAHIFRKNDELKQLILNPPLKPAKKADEVTPPKDLLAESTCEGSDLKPTRLNLTQDILEDSAQKPDTFRGPRIIRNEHKLESKEDRIIRRRKRKSIDQLKMLYNEYKKNPNWNKTTMSDMAIRTGLSEAQVYKWSWDQKKKKIEE